MKGQIDIVKPAGVVEGWCWDEDAPNTRLEVSILVDGVVAGNAIAGLYREDLHQANIGDGFHHFSLTLTSHLASKPTYTLVLIHNDTGTPIGEAFVCHNKVGITFDDRLAELEARNRLLESRLAEMARSESKASEAELFSVIGVFFSKLAEDASHGLQPGFALHIGHLVQAKIKAYPVLDFGRPAKPTFSIFVNADCSMAQLHAALTALHRAGAASMAALTVFDPGQFDDVVLIPSVVRGIVYIRKVKDFVSEFTEFEANVDTDLILILSGRALISETFLHEIKECASFHMTAGAIGACIINDKGSFLHGGLYLKSGELTTDREESLLHVHPAHALTQHAVAIRPTALRETKGLNSLFEDDVKAALIDLCFRLRRDGYNVLVEPYATFALQGDGDDLSITPHSGRDGSRSRQFLRASWFGQEVSLCAGHALVVGTSNPNTDDLHAVKYLGEASYSVTYVAHDGQGAETTRQLQRAGATVVFDMNAHIGLPTKEPDIVYVSGDTLRSLPAYSAAQLINSLTQLETFLAAQNLFASVM